MGSWWKERVRGGELVVGGRGVWLEGSIVSWPLPTDVGHLVNDSV